MNDATASVSTIGIVDGERAQHVVDATADAVAECGGEYTVGTAASLAELDVDVIVAPTEGAIYECVRTRTSAPVLAVGATPALRGVARNDVEAAISTLVDSGVRTEARRTVAVESDVADRTRALADVTLITREPARISEYAIYTDGDRVGSFRADGIVLATPVGSQGYARAAGSHVLAPNTDVLAAVPVAPFATTTNEWVLPHDEVTVSVERDEGVISLRVDDTQHATLGHGDQVTVTPDTPLALAVTPESTGPWPTALEKH